MLTGKTQNEQINTRFMEEINIIKKIKDWKRRLCGRKVCLEEVENGGGKWSKVKGASHVLVLGGTCFRQSPCGGT